MRRRWRAAGVLAALTLLLATPMPAVAAQGQAAPPVTVPALTDWTPASGSYVYGRSARLVADSARERRVADTLAGDLRDAGHSTPPVVSGGARPGDIVVDFEGEKLASAEGITGAKISLWPDNGRGETENEVAVALWPALRHIAQATWGDPHPDGTYAEFAARGTAVGHAPGWADLTRVPVRGGTYVFRTPGRSFEAEVTRTADGYATVRTAGGCLEIRGGKLTLNVPLQSGAEATPQACDPRNTLQRWQLEATAGGYRLVNAITRMTVSPTGEGRLAQYPPDQGTPAVWHLSN